MINDSISYFEYFDNYITKYFAFEGKNAETLLFFTLN